MNWILIQQQKKLRQHEHSDFRSLLNRRMKNLIAKNSDTIIDSVRFNVLAHQRSACIINIKKRMNSLWELLIWIRFMRLRRIILIWRERFMRNIQLSVHWYGYLYLGHIIKFLHKNRKIFIKKYLQFFNILHKKNFSTLFRIWFWEFPRLSWPVWAERRFFISIKSHKEQGLVCMEGSLI